MKVSKMTKFPPQKEKKQLKENLTLIIPEFSLQSYSLNVFSE